MELHANLERNLILLVPKRLKKDPLQGSIYANLQYALYIRDKNNKITG